MSTEKRVSSRKTNSPVQNGATPPISSGSEEDLGFSSTERGGMIGPYHHTKLLGKGAYAVVKLGVHQSTGEKVAIKFINKAAARKTPAILQRIEREVSVLQILNHPHITKFIDFMETEQFYVIVMEFVPGKDLYAFLMKACAMGGLPISEAFLLFYQMVSALEYCHSCGIVHRDIKPENILMEGMQIKLADFGMANITKEAQLLETACGSPHYAAPEVIRGKKYIGTASDVWSLGIVLFAMCAGRLPFVDESMPRLLEMITRGTFEMPFYFDDDLRDLIAHMLDVSSKSRITLRQIKHHPWWLKNCVVLGLNPLGIHTAASVLQTHLASQSDTESLGATSMPTSPEMASSPVSRSPEMAGKLPGAAHRPSTELELSPTVRTTPRDATVLAEPFDKEILDFIFRMQGWTDMDGLMEKLRAPGSNYVKMLYINMSRQKKNTGSLLQLKISNTKSLGTQSAPTTPQHVPADRKVQDTHRSSGSSSTEESKTPRTPTTPVTPTLNKSGKMRTILSNLREKIGRRVSST